MSRKAPTPPPYQQIDKGKNPLPPQQRRPPPPPAPPPPKKPIEE